MANSSWNESSLDETLRPPTNNHSPYLKDLYAEIDTLRKENFQLRLRVHLFEVKNNSTATTPVAVKTNNDRCQLFVSDRGSGGPSASFSGGQNSVDTKLNQSSNLFKGTDLESQLMKTKSQLMNALGNCTSLKNEVRRLKNLNVDLFRALREFGFNTLKMEAEMKQVLNENQHDEDFNMAFIQSFTSFGDDTTVTVPELYHDRQSCAAAAAAIQTSTEETEQPLSPFDSRPQLCTLNLNTDEDDKMPRK